MFMCKILCEHVLSVLLGYLGWCSDQIQVFWCAGHLLICPKILSPALFYSASHFPSSFGLCFHWVGLLGGASGRLKGGRREKPGTSPLLPCRLLCKVTQAVSPAAGVSCSSCCFSFCEPASCQEGFPCFQLLLDGPGFGVPVILPPP